jgi:acyl CoA:acetate/3-ketoacid CoA transferase alpha subunit
LNNYSLGRLNFSVVGDSPVAALVRQELVSIRTGDVSQPELLFCWADSMPAIEKPTLLTPYKIAIDKIAIQQSGLDYQISKIDGVWTVTLAPSASGHGVSSRATATASDSWERFRDWNYLSKTETLAKTFMYDVFDHVTQSCQIAKKQTYLHASSMTRDGRGVVIAGWGGVGKTTSVLKLVTEHGWKYMSDDLALVSDDGTLYRHPKRIQIYAYNLIGQPALKAGLMKGRGIADRLSWNIRLQLRGVKGVRRRVSAEEFFGDEHVGTSVQASELFLMERAACASIEVHPLELDQAVDRMTATLLHELSPFTDVNNACRAGGLQIGVPSIETTLKSTSQILQKAFDGVKPKLVRVPPKTGPNELADVMLKHLA